jgi:hypothetical protein
MAQLGRTGGGDGLGGLPGRDGQRVGTASVCSSAARWQRKFARDPPAAYSANSCRTDREFFLNIFHQFR